MQSKSFLTDLNIFFMIKEYIYGYIVKLKVSNQIFAQEQITFCFIILYLYA